MPMSERTLDQWVLELSAALDLPADSLEVSVLLDLARDVAHGVARPAAPLTTFLVGLAAGRAGAARADVLAAVTTAQTALATG
jgi:hypothetical protein